MDEDDKKRRDAEMEDFVADTISDEEGVAEKTETPPAEFELDEKTARMLGIGDDDDADGDDDE